MIQVRSFKRNGRVSHAWEQEEIQCCFQLLRTDMVTGKQFMPTGNTLERHIADSALYVSALRRYPNVRVPTNLNQKRWKEVSTFRSKISWIH
jgi:hypothetical protein